MDIGKQVLCTKQQLKFVIIAKNVHKQIKEELKSPKV